MRAAFVLIAALLPVSAVAEAPLDGTATQHLEWTRKFVPRAEPAVTGSASTALCDVDVSAPGGCSSAGTSPPHCELSGISFGHLPFERWRILQCR